MPNKCDDVARLKRLEQRLDRQFSVLGVKFGLDGIVGLVPVVGDAVTAAFGLYLVFEARRLGARRWTMARMMLNLAVDAGVGAVPVLGDVFDVAFRSNTKNVRLLIADLERRAGELREVNREAIRAA
ncbi:MAG: DUF4112 domain-containing protein [Alphaproteobacteria bacterium]|nr:DUF4112 domain-containing protein [Alphaproteobacteria bacterium]